MEPGIELEYSLACKKHSSCSERFSYKLDNADVLLLTAILTVIINGFCGDTLNKYTRFESIRNGRVLVFWRTDIFSLSEKGLRYW